MHGAQILHDTTQSHFNDEVIRRIMQVGVVCQIQHVEIGHLTHDVGQTHETVVLEMQLSEHMHHRNVLRQCVDIVVVEKDVRQRVLKAPALHRHFEDGIPG